MYYQQVEKINTDIDRTRKAIITLGCSFVQGQGAMTDSLYEEYEWIFERLGLPISMVVPSNKKQELIEKYPNVELNPFTNKLDFTFMEYDNAFGNLLATKYFNGEYASINFGVRGNGNRATIKELYFHPELHWHNLDEIIVIYCPSGMERLDFVSDGWTGHHHWATAWPHYKDIAQGPRKILSEGYNKRLSSEKFEIIEQITHVQELLMWCEARNAKLIITPAFNREYTREYFEKHLLIAVGRDIEGNILNNNQNIIQQEVKNELTRLIDLWPWDKMFYPSEYPTFVDLCMAQEFSDWKYQHFFEFTGIGTPQKWVTPCAHPAAKGHDLFAKNLHEHIINNLK
jgi:hypothetical protein